MKEIILVGLGVGIVWWAWFVASYNLVVPNKASICTNDCEQGRRCTCVTEAEMEKHRIDDEFNGANWPFPTGPRP